VCVVGGTGTFNFASDLCAGVSDGVPPEVSTACTVSASGPWQNVVCGSTAAAQGTANVAVAAEANEVESLETEADGPTDTDEVDTVTYGIIFVGGVGGLTGNAGPSQADAAGTFEDFVGVVLWIVGPVGNPTQNQCVSAFGVDSAYVALDLPIALPPLPPL